MAFPVGPVDGDTYTIGSNLFTYEAASTTWKLSVTGPGATIPEGTDDLATTGTDVSQRTWPATAFAAVGAAGADAEPVTQADFFIASSATFPTSVHSGTTTNAGSGTLVWSNYPTVTTSTSTYAGQATSTTTDTTADAAILHQVGDWVQMSNSVSSSFSFHQSFFTVTLNGIDVATTHATVAGGGSASGGGYITQAMIDAGDGNPLNDVWTYSLSDSGGSSSANGGATIYADSQL